MKKQVLYLLTCGALLASCNFDSRDSIPSVESSSSESSSSLEERSYTDSESREELNISPDDISVDFSTIDANLKQEDTLVTHADSVLSAYSMSYVVNDRVINIGEGSLNLPKSNYPYFNCYYKDWVTNVTTSHQGEGFTTVAFNSYNENASYEYADFNSKTAYRYGNTFEKQNGMVKDDSYQETYITFTNKLKADQYNYSLLRDSYEHLTLETTANPIESYVMILLQDDAMNIFESVLNRYHDTKDQVQKSEIPTPTTDIRVASSGNGQFDFYFTYSFNDLTNGTSKTDVSYEAYVHFESYMLTKAYIKDTTTVRRYYSLEHLDSYTEEKTTQYTTFLQDFTQKTIPSKPESNN